MIIEATKYEFVKEVPLGNVYSKYAKHRRLGVYARHGFKCSNPRCNRVGTRLIIGEDCNGGIHVDVYTDDLILMTVDHLVPVSKGGKDTFDNKVPLCQPCNTLKGNKFEGLEGFSNLPESKAFKKKQRRLNSYARRWRKVVRRTELFTLVNVSPLMIRNLTIQELRIGNPKEEN